MELHYSMQVPKSDESQFSSNTYSLSLTNLCALFVAISLTLFFRRVRQLALNTSLTFCSIPSLTETPVHSVLSSAERRFTKPGQKGEQWPIHVTESLTRVTVSVWQGNHCTLPQDKGRFCIIFLAKLTEWMTHFLMAVWPQNNIIIFLR